MAAPAATTHFQKNAKRQSTLTRRSSRTYRKRCKAGGKGFMSGGGKKWQAHHILCDHAMGGRVLPSGSEEFIENCLWVMPWDINDPPNMYGMPLKRQYAASGGKVPLNIPAHDVDHNTRDGYTDECKKWLKDHVWDVIDSKKRNPHKVEVKALKRLVEQCTATFLARLKARGLRALGTYACWKMQNKWRNHWYKPFSMAATPTKRQPLPLDSSGAGLDDMWKAIS